MEACDVLIETGCSKGLARLKKSDVPQLVRNTALSCIVLKIKAELDQFMAGLNEAGVLPCYTKVSRPPSSNVCSVRFIECRYDINPENNKCIHSSFTGKIIDTGLNRC